LSRQKFSRVRGIKVRPRPLSRPSRHRRASWGGKDRRLICPDLRSGSLSDAVIGNRSVSLPRTWASSGRCRAAARAYQRPMLPRRVRGRTSMFRAIGLRSPTVALASEQRRPPAKGSPEFSSVAVRSSPPKFGGHP
jgi:hypothetical protein